MTAPVPDHAALPRVTPPLPVEPEVFWTCDDSVERLSHDVMEDAITEFVDGFLAPGCDTEAILRSQVAPLTVYGYSRAEVTDKKLESEGVRLVENLVENLNEDEWGDPEGQHDIIDEATQERLARAFITALKAERQHIVPWSCEQTKTVVLEADELVALVRELAPSWFDGGTTT